MPIADKPISDRDPETQVQPGQEPVSEAFARAQKMAILGQLAGGIAHEINTPLQYIGLNLDFVSSVVEDLEQIVRQAALHELATPQDIEDVTEELPRALAETKEGLQHIIKIVQAMRVYSYPGDDKKAPCDINETIRVALTLSRNQWKHAAEMTEMLGTTLPPTQAIANELTQVWINLLVNAAQAIEEASKPGEGSITITSRVAADGWIEVEVEDNGIGMTPETLARCSEPFFTTKAVGRGSGQGLSLTKRIIENQHGGKVVINSKAGSGTTITVRLPVE